MLDLRSCVKQKGGPIPPGELRRLLWRCRCERSMLGQKQGNVGRGSMRKIAQLEWIELAQRGNKPNSCTSHVSLLMQLLFSSDQRHSDYDRISNLHVVMSLY